jgi:integrase
VLPNIIKKEIQRTIVAVRRQRVCGFVFFSFPFSLQRLRSLGTGATWILHGRTGEPVDLGNARKRKLHPTAAAIGIKVGGWHDFRHTLKRQMRRAGVDPVIVRDTLGHKRVEQQDVYDVARRTEVGNALRLVGRQLEPNVEPNQPIQ